MKSLLLILLAGYAVRSDENNYYVVEMLHDPPTKSKEPFEVYWNVPSMQCSSKKVYFENLYEKFGIIQNDQDRFKGEKITILYDPGLFPALFKNETSGKFRFRNGGVPQEGDLNKHLDEFKKELDSSIPDTDFNGIGIIDFESWRPVFRQNFGVLVPYKDVSYEIERKLHSWWPESWIEAEAKRRFEESARTFMQSTLSVAKQLRPRARWGFYGFPYCFNMASNNMVEECASKVPEENDQISWLWTESSALYPSVYSSVQLSGAQLAALARGRVREAARLAPGGDVLPYFWFRYRDAGYFSETDLDIALSTLYKSNASGIILWGSSNDVNTVAKCNKLLNYVETVLGPAIAKYTKPLIRFNDENNIDKTTISPTNVSTDGPLVENSSNVDTTLELDPEFHWTPPENYTQDIKSYVEDEINRKFSQNVTTADDNDTVLQNNSVLIDLILNTILNSVDEPSSDISTNKETKNDLSDDGILVSSIEVKVTSTETSQITSGVVTNSPLLDEVNNTSPLVESTVFDTISTVSPKPVETTTEKVKIQTEDYDEISFKSELESIDSLFDITTTGKFNVDEVTDSYYDATLYGDDDYFFNVDTFFKNDDSTTTVTNDLVVDETTTSKNYKETTHKTSTENSLPKTNDLGTTTDNVIDLNLATTDRNDKSKTLISEFTDDYFTTESINKEKEISKSSTEETEVTEHSYNIPLTLNQTKLKEISIEGIEASTLGSHELTAKNTKTDQSETTNSSILTNTENSQILKASKTMESSDVTTYLDTAEESEATSTKTPEETSTIMPTSDQVDV